MEPTNNTLEESYRAFASTPAYRDLMEYLASLKEEALARAIGEPEPIKAVSYLQNANGYSIVKEYLERVTAPSDQ